VKLIDKRTVLDTHPFKVEELTLEHDDGKPYAYPYHRFVCPDWVNVLAVTHDHRAVLIRQPRAGALKRVLEVPGGTLDPGESRDPMMAALRELEEETGFTSQRVLPLGALNPNPAIQTNRCHFFLALAAAPAQTRRHFPDAEERIEVELVPVTELDALVRTGQVDHALSALCIMLAGKYVQLAPDPPAPK
jgi:8-oxo-dGTP pyrophosphatase MutT (NUDIX family)